MLLSVPCDAMVDSFRHREEVYAPQLVMRRDGGPFRHREEVYAPQLAMRRDGGPFRHREEVYAPQLVVSSRCLSSRCSSAAAVRVRHDGDKSSRRVPVRRDGDWPSRRDAI